MLFGSFVAVLTYLNYRVRNLEEFNNYVLLSATNRTAYITLWTASWCASCKTVSPIVKDLIESEGIGEKHGGVSYAEVEIDSPDIGDLPLRYLVRRFLYFGFLPTEQNAS